MIHNEAEKVNRINTFLSKTQAEELIKEHMAENGLPCPDSIKFNTGTRQRYSADEKKNKRDEYYYATYAEGEYCYAGYGSFSDSDQSKSFIECYFTSGGSVITHEIKEKIQEERLKMRHDMEIYRKQRSDYCSSEWSKYPIKPYMEGHKDYLEYKHVHNYGLRFGLYEVGEKSIPSLVIPLRDIDHKITTLQYIFKVEGTFYKRFVKDAPKKESFFILNEEEIEQQSTIYVCEGYATAASVYEVVKKEKVHVITAFDADNILACLRVLVKKYKDVHFIVAADNDEKGLKIAEQCCKELSVSMVIPTIQKPEGTDFNDLYVQKGTEAVQECLSNEITFKTKIEELREYADKELLDSDPCKIFNLEVLPPVLSHYIKELCEASQGVKNIAPIMMTNVVVALLSGFIKKRFYIYLARSAPKLYCNLWYLNIADSGSGKSFALSVGSYLGLERREKIIQKIKESLNTYDNDTVIVKNQKEEAKRLYWLQDVFLANRMTSEGLMEELAYGRSGLIQHNEFANFIQNLEKKFNGDLKGTLTDFYDCSKNATSYKKANNITITVNEPYISLSSMSTLEWVKKNLTIEDSSAGFAARMLMFYIVPVPQSDKAKCLPPSLYNKKIEIQQDIHVDMRRVVEKIIPPVSESPIENNNYKDREFIFTQESWEYYCKLREKIAEFPKKFDEKTCSILIPFANRWETTLVKLAIIMQFLYNQECDEGFAYNGEVEHSTLEVKAFDAAMNILQCAMNSTANLYIGGLGNSEHVENRQKVYNYILKRTAQGKITKLSNIIKSYVLDKGSREYESILETLVNGDLIEEIKAKVKKDTVYRIIMKE